MSYFYENLKKARLEKRLSQKEVAEAIGVAKSTYSLYESGKREPNVKTIKKIASFLGVSGDSLLGTEPQVSTIAAHHDDEDFTPEELAEIEEFKKYVLSKRDKDD